MLKIRQLFSVFWPMLVGIIVGVIAMVINPQLRFSKTVSPLSPLGEILEGSVKSRTSVKQVIGFLPYWLVKKAEVPFDVLNQLVYFGVTLSADGNLLKRKTSQEMELGWHTLGLNETQNLLKQSRAKKVKTILAVTAFDNELIDNLTSDPSIKDRAIEAIATTVNDYHFDGANIDFEYVFTKKFSPQSGQNLAQFLKDLKFRLQQDNSQAIVSVDLYVNGVIHDQPYNITALSESADQVIIMAYDFHTQHSSQAGPVAPLRSDGSFKSITEGLQAALRKKVPLNKLILGIPLYGYEWQTTSKEFMAPTYPESGVLATYKRIKQLLREEDLEIFWDASSLSPWLTYEKDGKIQQVYFDNERSINYKLQLVDQLQMQGVAFWALGYEGEEKQIWTGVKDWQEKD